MRLWHKDLIPYLPRQQLLAQWRECCAIAGSVAKKGTPNHLLVNKIMKYKYCDFLDYAKYVVNELKRRGYKVSEQSWEKFFNHIKYSSIMKVPKIGEREIIFENWHNERYLKQCLFNLQEKYDCGGIPENEWKIIENKFGQYLKLNVELEKRG